MGTHLLRSREAQVGGEAGPRPEPEGEPPTPSQTGPAPAARRGPRPDQGLLAHRTIGGSMGGEAGEGGRPGWGGWGWYLHDDLLVGAVHLDFLKHMQEVLGLHPNSVGKKHPHPVSSLAQSPGARSLA